MVLPNRDESKLPLFNEVHRFFELSLDLFAISGFDGYLKRVNSAWERTLGYSTAELLSRPVIEFVHPEDRGVTLTQRQQIHTGVPVLNFENRYVCKDGSIRWLEWTAYPYPEEGLNYIVGRDVTDRKQAQEALRQSEKTLRDFIDASEDIAFLCDLDGNFIQFNDKALERFLKTEAQLLASNIFDELGAEAAAIRRPHHDAVIATRQTHHYVSRLYGRDYEVTIAPVVNTSGRVVSLATFAHDITALKQAEAALRESEASFRHMADTAPVFIWTTTPDKQADFVNQTWINFRGRSPEQELGDGWLESIHPDDYERVVRTFNQTFDARQPFDMEFRAQRADGEYRWLLDTGVPRFAADGTFLGYVGSAIDIHDRKMAETALRHSEKTLRELLNGSQDMAYLTDKQGTLIALNTKFARLLGIVPDDGHDLNIYDILPPGSAEMTGAMVNRVLSSRQPIHEEVEIDGQFFDYSIYPILDEAGEVKSLATFSRDITQRKQMEQKLRNSEEQFRSVLESAAEGILLADATGAILLVNQHVETLFGYTREELFGQSVDILLPEALRVAHSRHRQSYAEHPSIRPMGAGRELFGRRKDGSVFPIEVSLSYMRRDEGLLVMAFIADITERKQMEQERLNHQRQQLEIQRERELIELRQRFTSMVSHEFRTPLTVIASSAELLEHYYDRLPRERQIEKLQLINGQVRSMINLLDDMLALSKIQSGAADFTPEPLDMTTLCERILENIRLIDRGQHQFVYDHRYMPSHIQADPRLLEHIITNLLSNAVKYSPPGSSVHCSLVGTETGVRLEIRDEGIGIPESEQAHLFEPFYRASNARAVEGTGLGLAIVKHNVEKHGGTIRCHSVTGHGTTFIVELPVSISPEDDGEF